MISLSSIIIFPILLLLYYTLPVKWQRYMLLLTSLVFALSLGAYTLLALVVAASVVFLGVKIMVVSCQKRPWAVALVILVIVALMGVKYLRFFADAVNILLGMTGFDTAIGVSLQPVAVVGCSFYSLRLIGYVIDVYHGQDAVGDYVDFLSFVSFFPIFTAGPIEKSSRLLGSMSGHKSFDEQKVYRGFITALYGLFLKQVIADRIAILVNEIYTDDSYTGAICLVMIILYSVEIYADFAGYSYIAMGVSGMLSIDIMENFRRPYLAVGIRDFWRRWHISLSRWLRDYLYIPLGGNRNGLLRKELNIIITFLISGLWHGTSWHFVVWGGLHGIFQAAEDIVDSVRHEAGLDRKTVTVMGSVTRVVFTFILVTIAWVFFRADSVSQALGILSKIVTSFGAGTLIDGTLFNMGLGRLQVCGIFLAVAVMVAFELLQEKRMITMTGYENCPRWLRWAVSYAAIIWMVIAAVQVYGIGQDATFIYAKF